MEIFSRLLKLLMLLNKNQDSGGDKSILPMRVCKIIEIFCWNLGLNNHVYEDKSGSIETSMCRLL